MSRAVQRLRVSQLNALPAEYAPMLQLQEVLAEQRQRDLIPDTLLQLQHQHVYTIGKRGSPADIRASLGQLRGCGAAPSVHSVPRGGETTYHGPGQLVVYPIISLRALGIGARAYVEGLEDVMIRTLGRFGLSARGRVPGRTGVWVGERKIGAVGVRISSGVASHGVALNVCTDLSYFDHIVPCGAPDKEVTSMKRELQGWRHEHPSHLAPSRQQQRQRQHPQQLPAATHQHGHLQQQQQQQQCAEGCQPLWLKQQQQGHNDAELEGLHVRAPCSCRGPAPQTPSGVLSVEHVAACFVDTFAAQFGYRDLQGAPDVHAIAAQLGCCKA